MEVKRGGSRKCSTCNNELGKLIWSAKNGYLRKQKTRTAFPKEPHKLRQPVVAWKKSGGESL